MRVLKRRLGLCSAIGVLLIAISLSIVMPRVGAKGVVSWPEHGSLSGIAPNLIYTPDPGFVGVDSFTFKASDGVLESNIATVTITVLAHEDVNGDMAVDVLDLVLIGQHWSESGEPGWLKEDVNKDGQINVLDMVLVGQNMEMG